MSTSPFFPHFQSAITTPQQHELLITRLRGLCHEWTEFCDQEVVLQLGGDDRSDSVAAAVASRATSNSSAAAGVLASSGQIGGRVTVRVRKSLTAKRRLSYVRYLGAVETDKLVGKFFAVCEFLFFGNHFLGGLDCSFNLNVSVIPIG